MNDILNKVNQIVEESDKKERENEAQKLMEKLEAQKFIRNDIELLIDNIAKTDFLIKI